MWTVGFSRLLFHNLILLGWARGDILLGCRISFLLFQRRFSTTALHVSGSLTSICSCTCGLKCITFMRKNDYFAFLSLSFGVSFWSLFLYNLRTLSELSVECLRFLYRWLASALCFPTFFPLRKKHLSWCSEGAATVERPTLNLNVPSSSLAMWNRECAVRRAVWELIYCINVYQSRFLHHFVANTLSHVL